MSSDRETVRLVREWLDDEETRLPDRVLDSVLDRVPVTPQRRGPFAGWSLSSPIVSMSLAAAAVIVLALVGLNLLGPTNVGPPGPSDVASPSPDVTTNLEFWTGRDVPGGTYVIGEPFPARITMTVPAGWTAFGVTDGLAAICSNSCQQPDRAGLGFWIVQNVYADPCDASGVADPPIGPTVDDLVDALGALPRHEATEPRPETIGGLPATYIELTAEEERGDCALPGFRAWTAGSDLRESPPGERNRLWILDMDGTRVMVDLAIPPNADADLVAELEGVIASLRIEPATAP